jgi:hypothetical protein
VTAGSRENVAVVTKNAGKPRTKGGYEILEKLDALEIRLNALVRYRKLKEDVAFRLKQTEKGRAWILLFRPRSLVPECLVRVICLKRGPSSKPFGAFSGRFEFWRAPGWAESKPDISRGTILVR